MEGKGKDAREGTGGGLTTCGRAAVVTLPEAPGPAWLCSWRNTWPGELAMPRDARFREAHLSLGHQPLCPEPARPVGDLHGWGLLSSGNSLLLLSQALPRGWDPTASLPVGGRGKVRGTSGARGRATGSHLREGAGREVSGWGSEGLASGRADQPGPGAQPPLSLSRGCRAAG